ncbi:lipid II flippase MurJ [Planococcus dechangensis]|uniref:Lipid II flippase MurJ n=1 Tax=Planococcus dechangensis TaxID=1176255 RepID=A0ABV9MAS5_9BACL
MKNKIVHYILILLFSTFIIRILNFFKEIQISYFYGTNSEVDHYNIMLIIPNIMLNSIGPALGLLIISLISTEKKLISLQRKDVYFLVGLATLLISLGYFSTFSIETTNFYYPLMTILITFLYFMQVSLVYYLQAYNEFKIGSISSFLQVIINICILFISFYVLHSFILIISLALGLVVQIIFLLIIINKKQYFHQVRIVSLKENEFIHPVMSMILGFGLIEILLSVQKIILSRTNTDGIISALNYAYKIMNLPISIFLFAVLTGLFPTLIKIKDQIEFQFYFRKTLNTILLLMVPISVFFFIYSSEIVSILFERGEFDEQSTNITSSQLQILSLLIVPVSILTIFLRFLYVEKKWSVIYKTTSLIIITHIVLNIIIISNKVLEYSVISIPLSILFGLMYCYRKLKTPLFNFDQLKILLGSFLLGLSGILLENEVTGLLSFILISILIFLVYIFSQLILRNRTLLSLKGSWK